MTNISSISSSSPYADDSKSADKIFDDKVLHYIQQNRPQGKLSELMIQMRAFSPDKAVTMFQLKEALLKADASLRKTEEYKDYTDNVLDKRAIQLVGVNMFFENMLYKSFTDSDNDTSL